MPFSPSSKTRIVLAVANEGKFAGSRRGTRFSLKRESDGIAYKVRKGRKWEYGGEQTVWRALEEIDRRIR